MIKKIILLVLSFSFSVTSVVYGTVTKADPVTSGTGAGTSVKIENTSALSNVMSQIPSFDDYTGEQSISEKYPDFKPFTMIETGYGEKTTERTYTRETVKDGQKEYVNLIQRNIETTNHSLSISFTEDAVYYHSVGSKISTNVYFEYEIQEGNDGEYKYDYYSFYEDDFVDAERTIINFDAEIYHSKEATLIKYNKWETLKEVATTQQYERPLYEAAPEEVIDENDAEALQEKKMLDMAQKMREDNYGTWLKLEIFSDEELADKYSNPPADVESEAYMNYMLDYMVDMTCSQISLQERDSIVTANAQNCVYLGILSDFITSENENVSFEKSGNEYKLINSKRVQTGTDKETGEALYETLDVGEEAYISAIFGNQYNNSDNYWTSVNFSYVVGSDVAVVDQNAHWGSQTTRYNHGLDTAFKMDTVTNFFALGNTVASVEKGAKVKTISEAFGDGLREMVLTLMGGEEN